MQIENRDAYKKVSIYWVGIINKNIEYADEGRLYYSLPADC